MKGHDRSKRDFLKKAAYVAPVIATFSVAPALATIGSNMHKQKGNNGVGNGCDPQPPGMPPQNDSCGSTGPGKPGNRHRFFDKKNRFFSKNRNK